MGSRGITQLLLKTPCLTQYPQQRRPPTLGPHRHLWHRLQGPHGQGGQVMAELAGNAQEGNAQEQDDGSKRNRGGQGSGDDGRSPHVLGACNERRKVYSVVVAMVTIATAVQFVSLSPPALAA